LLNLSLNLNLPITLADFINSLLDGFLDFAATQATGADPDALGLTVD
jgi:hypothetical protein